MRHLGDAKPSAYGLKPQGRKIAHGISDRMFKISQMRFNRHGSGPTHQVADKSCGGDLPIPKCSRAHVTCKTDQDLTEMRHQGSGLKSQYYSDGEERDLIVDI